MSKISDYRLLSFDVYGTLIDWETGLVDALQPALLKEKKADAFTREHLLDTFHGIEKDQQSKTPSMPYSQLLTIVFPRLMAALGLAEPSEEESVAFGKSIGSWPAFPDTVDALQRLGRHFKLVVLSNVDRDSFQASNAGPLKGVRLDAVLTAQDIGSYKPNPRNFTYMLSTAKEKFGVEKNQVLQTAQSQFHDHHPARKMGIKGVWIVRPGGIMGNVAESEEIYDWKFDTMGEMADALEKELAESG